MSTLRYYATGLMREFKEDNITLLAAAQAYYYLLAVFPLLIVCFAIIPYFNIDAGEVIQFIQSFVPGEFASMFEENIVSFIETPRGGLLTVGIIGAIWSASNGVNAFIKSSNEAYEVEETRSFIIVRLIAFGLTLGMILALIVAILLPVFGNIIVEFLSSYLGITNEMTLLLQIGRWVISIVVLSAFLLCLYRFAPNKKMPFKHIIPGAVSASILWQILTIGFSFYVSNFGNYSATYGSIGGIIVLMIWFFLTGIVLMIGASLNVLYHQRQIAEDHVIYKEESAR
ncbi:YihY/virulence factor BrkB family protein [Oceanobacillus chungangensis]|uniref:Ribonuclease n=1 Tax=Oceanobacillus chungangensis TaxID=1229152 RepID=A0A3D8PSC7_9BACI|nr:YihY/virulence factor BrkB family protein [Oceanobacillus chungangensis]RDW18622.1 ribonuclease [Oceanobacillus chungangensis]